MDKNYICQKAYNGIASATKMEITVYDNETKQYKTEYYDVTDATRQSALNAIKEFQDNDSERKVIYHGHDDIADYLYFLEVRDDELALVSEIDYGMRLHNSYTKPEEILYRFDELEKIKENLIEEKGMTK